MNYWYDHSIMYIVAIVVCPRMMLIYYGLITPMQIPPILGMMFVPRMFVASVITTAYGNTNQTLVIVCWILAVLFDIIGFVFKLMFSAQMMKFNIEQFRNNMERMNRY